MNRSRPSAASTLMTPLLSACQANLDGLGMRRKVRLRWYDSLRPGTTFFFEIKWRHDRVTGKHRLQLESAEPLGELTYKQIVAGLGQVIPPEYLGDVFVSCEPTVHCAIPARAFCVR